MSIIKRVEPTREIEDFMNRMQRFFAAPFDLGEQPLTTTQWAPAVDISESNEGYVITAELPDVKKEDIKISVNDGVLSFSGERRQEKEEKHKKLHRIERAYGRFERSFTLPNAVDTSKVAATCKDGLLTIQVPKSTQTSTSREIKVQ